MNVTDVHFISIQLCIVHNSTLLKMTIESEQESNIEIETPKKVSLLKKYDIPLEHLDFKYVETCQDVKELEKILKILQSGEEGYFPDLVKASRDRLTELNPSSHVLRVVTPVLRPEHLSQEQRNEIQNDISNWLSKTDEKDSGANIFSSDPKIYQLNCSVPIRGESRKITAGGDATTSQSTSRIKSWEYDKWDRYDAEAELMNLDIKDMQIKEWEKSQSTKMSKEHKLIQKLMKNDDTAETAIKKSEQKQKVPKESKDLHEDVNKPSYIEEITEELPCSSNQAMMRQQQQRQSSNQNKRRFKITIEDINVGSM